METRLRHGGWRASSPTAILPECTSLPPSRPTRSFLSRLISGGRPESSATEPAIVSATTQPQPDPAASLLADYKPLPGVADELVDAQGNLRAAWRPFIDGIAKLPPEELQR